MTRHRVIAIGTAILTLAALGFLPRGVNVSDLDGASPDPTRWKVSSPRAGSRDELRIDFGESLDHAVASRVIGVFDSSGVPMSGAVLVSADDRTWRFAPTGPWREGATLRVEPALDDLAGTNVARAFDADRALGATSTRLAKPYTARIAVTADTRTRHSWLGAHRPPPISFSP